MKYIAIAVMLLTLGGCGATTTELAKIDASVQTLMASDAKALTPDCRAGLAEGVTSGASISPDIESTIATMKAGANTDSKEYKDCMSWGAWTAFKVRAGKAKADEMISSIVSQLATLGLIK